MINRQVSNYRITNYLGYGSISEIYRACRVDDPNARYTVKIVKRGAADPDMFPARMQEVFENLKRLDHPYIIKYHDLLFDGDDCFLLMEFINGHTLAELARPKGIFPVIHVLGLFKQTLEAIAHAHSLSIIHGGFTADKAMFAIEKVLQVGDFGLRPALNEIGATSDRGNSAYFAPGMADAQVPLTEAEDIYALGVYLAHLLTGRAPDLTDGCASVVDYLRAQRPELPDRVFGIVAMATAHKLADRFQSVAEMLQIIADEESGVTAQMARSEPRRPGLLPVLNVRTRTAAAAVAPSISIEPEMIVIPPGPFLQGSNQNRNEQPLHIVNLPEFEISKYPITNRLYRIFCEKTGRKHPVDPVGWTNYFTYSPDHPVIHVTWEDARAYCEWLAETTRKSYRMPTESEWEKAARGGQEGQDYPWGAELPDRHAHYGGRAYAWELTRPGPQTLKVGSYPPNGYGLYDMAGNVWEWCENWYSPYGATEERKRRGIYRVVRGGSWGADAEMLRCAYRMSFSPGYKDYYLGFRVAKSL